MNRPGARHFRVPGKRGAKGKQYVKMPEFNLLLWLIRS